MIVLATPLILIAAAYVYYQSSFCRHCYAYAATPQVARAVLAFYSSKGRLPVNYAELKNLSRSGGMTPSVPSALWYGEWQVVSLDKQNRFAAIYRPLRDKPPTSSERIRELLSNSASTDEFQINGNYATAYEISSSTLEARELIDNDAPTIPPRRPIKLDQK